jgi:hypothetical protein
MFHILSDSVSLLSGAIFYKLYIAFGIRAALLSKYFYFTSFLLEMNFKSGNLLFVCCCFVGAALKLSLNLK